MEIDMKINKIQQEKRKNISKLERSINKSIDEICKKHDFEITYAEINAAILMIMKSNNEFELRELWSENNYEN